MNNGNEPAMPAEVFINSKDEMVANQVANNTWKTKGLSKREHFAAMAMQGILSGNISMPSGGKVTGADVSIIAVQAADALLKALES